VRTAPGFATVTLQLNPPCARRNRSKCSEAPLEPARATSDPTLILLRLVRVLDQLDPTFWV